MFHDSQSRGIHWRDVRIPVSEVLALVVVQKPKTGECVRIWYRQIGHDQSRQLEKPW